MIFSTVILFCKNDLYKDVNVENYDIFHFIKIKIVLWESHDNTSALDNSIKPDISELVKMSPVLVPVGLGKRSIQHNFNISINHVNYK